MLSSVQVQAPTNAALALLVALAILGTAPEPCPALLPTLATRRRVLPAARVATLVLLMSMAFAVQGSARTGATALLALTGEGLLAASVVTTRYAWILPLLHSLASALFGTDGFGNLKVWAWLLSTQPTITGLGASGAIFTFGLAAISRRGVS